MTIKTPRYSFIVPTYARPTLLGHALSSILQQTIDDWECIVVDNASPVPASVPDDGRFRLIRRSTNDGAGAARNVGIDGARGHYLLFLDDDDLITPDRLEICEEGLLIAPLVLCWGGQLNSRAIRKDMWEGDVGNKILNRLTPNLGQVLIPRDRAVRFDERFIGAEDVEWWLRQAQLLPVHTVSKVGWIWRRHDGPRFRSGIRARIAGRWLMLETHAPYFEERPDAASFQYHRLGLQYKAVGEFATARRAFLRSFRLRPSLRPVLHFLRTVRTQIISVQDQVEG
jgi:glycosyltransferase involved in cell wall biosynthesis